MCREWEALEHAALIKSLPHKAQRSTWKQKERWSQSWWLTPRKQHLPDTTGLITQMNLQRLWQHAQHLHRHNPRTKKGSGYKIPPFTKKVFAIDSHREREVQFSSVEWHWVFQAYSKAGSMLKDRWSTQTKSHVWFLLMCVCFVCVRGGGEVYFSFYF